MKSLIKKQVEFYKNNPGNLALDVVSLVPAVRGIRTGYQVYKYAKQAHKVAVNKGAQATMKNYKSMIGQLNVHSKNQNKLSKRSKIQH